MKLRQFQLAFALALTLAYPVRADSALREGFEGGTPVFQDAGGDATYKILALERVQGGAHRGTGCEQVRVMGNNGTHIYLSYDLGEAPVIGELLASVWIKADRPGMQILARVVLPRTKDPKTGRALTALLRGSGYTQAGHWQQLQIEDLPKALERQVRVMRAQNNPEVDGREAFVDRILLNVYGGPGTTNVSIDDLEVTGVVGRLSTDVRESSDTIVGGSTSPIQRLPPTDSAWSPKDTRPPAIRINATGFLIGDKSFFPRLVDYRGEPLALLKSLGFNGVRLTSPPVPALLSEAESTQMWLVAPPPSSRDLESRGGTGSTPRLDRQYDSILTWDLGHNLSTRELESVKRRADLVRSADSRSRPRICEADSDLKAYSRKVDLLWAYRFPLGTPLTFGQYSTWLRERPQHALPGIPIWTIIQTQPAGRVLDQAARLSDNPAATFEWQDEQIRSLVFAALASGVRGICFQSLSPLDASDSATRHRAALLEQINLELELIEPWCASGTFVTSAASNDVETTAAVMQTERARLVLPLAIAPYNQFAMRVTSTGATRYVVPGVPESNEAFEFSPGGFRPLRQDRAAGGISVVLPESQRGSWVVLTHDEVVKANLIHRVERIRKRATELANQLASMHLERIDDVVPRLAAKGHTPKQIQPLVEGARATLKKAQDQLEQGNMPVSLASARRCEQLLYQAERACWEQTLQSGVEPSNNPLGLAFQTLPEYWQFVGEIQSVERGPNMLPAGDFEDLDAMSRAGWRNFQHVQPDIQANVTPSSNQVHGGKFALKLQVTSAYPDKPTALVETAPLWVSSAPVMVEQGQMICIHGWVNVPQALTGSSDGLVIIDSLGGEPLAQQIGKTSGWKEITLYRVAPRSGMVVITFAMTGIGDAFLDDFAIQAVARRASAPVEQARMPSPTTRFGK